VEAGQIDSVATGARTQVNRRRSLSLLGLLGAASVGLVPGADAKKRKHKKNNKHKKTGKNQGSTRTVRETVTMTFGNPAKVTILAQANSKASPYPGIVNVSGLTNGVIQDVNLVLHGFTGSDHTEINVLLVQAREPSLNAIVINNIMDDENPNNITLILDDDASEPLSNNDSHTEFPDAGATYRFRPVNSGSMPIWPNAPAPSGNQDLRVFNGSDPNGTWQLFISTDNNNASPVTISGGWSLEITAEVDKEITVKKATKMR
jgi:hypothetical protein